MSSINSNILINDRLSLLCSLCMRDRQANYYPGKTASTRLAKICVARLQSEPWKVTSKCFVSRLLCRGVYIDARQKHREPCAFGCRANGVRPLQLVLLAAHRADRTNTKLGHFSLSENAGL